MEHFPLLIAAPFFFASIFRWISFPCRSVVIACFANDCCVAFLVLCRPFGDATKEGYAATFIYLAYSFFRSTLYYF